jgi:ABC-type dipeptide/oligopeptide/nickel transport system permease component
VSRRYLIRRLLLVVPVLLGTILLVFGMVFLAPGDPISRLAGNKPLSPSTYAAITERYHLDQPFVIQFWEYVKALRTVTSVPRSPVATSPTSSERFPVTLKLALGAFGVEVVLGLILAVTSALKRRTWIDSSILVGTLVMITVPTLVVGFLLQYVFGIKLGGSGRWHQAGWSSYVLPP